MHGKIERTGRLGNRGPDALPGAYRHEVRPATTGYAWAPPGTPEYDNNYLRRMPRRARQTRFLRKIAAATGTNRSSGVN